jgi:hypothetical protein
MDNDQLLPRNVPAPHQTISTVMSFGFVSELKAGDLEVQKFSIFTEVM